MSFLNFKRQSNPYGLQFQGLGFPTLMFIFAIFLEYSGIDLWLERHFYDAQAGWIYKNHWLLENVFHRGGKYLMIMVGVVLLMALIASLKRIEYIEWRRPLLAAVVGALSGILWVSILKKVSHIYSPWDLMIFNGNMPYLRMLDSTPLGIKAGNAFPAGHASGGFALFCLYFLSKTMPFAKPWLMAFAALTVGFTFGLAQQMRGAHFLSHDLVALAICWTANYVSFSLISPWKIFEEPC